MSLKEKYWKFLVQVRASLEYLDIYYEKSFKWDRAINIFLAISTSASIGSWIIWKELSVLWAIIIAVSQVISTLKSFLPFRVRISYIPSFSKELNELFIKCEKEWFYVSNDSLTEEQINILLYDFKTIYTAVNTGLIKCKSLPAKPKYCTLAARNAESYFKNFY